ncbi:hypothetical protein [Kurthia sp. Dielmo]|uniref:hypothetical protein n=1 Tax=Kurthia sp. Dielmo TaxID=1033738 RepID=UPI0002F1DC33|nr:hypothetical protein [Kurthia sp. Dielmo]
MVANIENDNLQITQNNSVHNSSVKIQKLIIDEFYPQDETFTRGPIIHGNNLTLRIHSFFGKHIDNIYGHETARAGRFNNTTSTILHAFNNLLNVEGNEAIQVDNETENNISEEDKKFLHFTNIISKQLLHNIGRKAQKNFLFVIIQCEHLEHGELIAIMKMERVFGVRYSEEKLTEQLDLLPDKQTALQKGAIILKTKLEEFPVSDNYREDTTAFHTRFLDRNDSTISKYFMKGFLDNSIINGNKENTKSAITQINLQLSPYLKEDYTDKAISNYLYENISYGSHTSVSELVKMVVNNSPLINKKLLENSNQDVTTISNNVFNEMLNQNSSACAEFQIETIEIEKINISDLESSGKLMRLSIAKKYLVCKEVELNITEDAIEDIDFNDKMLIAISKDLLNIEEINSILEKYDL